MYVGPWYVCMCIKFYGLWGLVCRWVIDLCYFSFEFKV